MMIMIIGSNVEHVVFNYHSCLNCSWVIFELVTLHVYSCIVGEVTTIATTKLRTAAAATTITTSTTTRKTWATITTSATATTTKKQQKHLLVVRLFPVRKELRWFRQASSTIINPSDRTTDSWLDIAIRQFDTNRGAIRRQWCFRNSRRSTYCDAEGILAYLIDWEKTKLWLMR